MRKIKLVIAVQNGVVQAIGFEGDVAVEFAAQVIDYDCPTGMQTIAVEQSDRSAAEAGVYRVQVERSFGSVDRIHKAARVVQHDGHVRSDKPATVVPIRATEVEAAEDCEPMQFNGDYDSLSRVRA